MSEATSEQRELRERVVGEYLPAWCATKGMDPLALKDPEWDSFLTPGLAHWFLAAIDESVVEVTTGGDVMLGESYPDGIFDHAGRKDEIPRRPRVRKESFLEVAAVAMLAIRYHWPRERLTFQAEGWSLDFLAYADHSPSAVAIAGEAKLKQRDAEKLWASLEICGARGDHEEADCSEHRNHHRKYEGLLKFRPRILWIVGPEALVAAPDLVFRVEESSSGVVRLDRADASELTFSSD